MSRDVDSDAEKLSQIASCYLDEAVTLFLEKAELTGDDKGKWFELVYCILAGTQFPVRKLKPLFRVLMLDENRSLIDLKRFSQASGREELATFLKLHGYRYYNQKAITIQNAANFFTNNYDGEISKFVGVGLSKDDLRGLLTSQVGGIGFKIASHWLRNIGFDICTIDLHLRRLFYNLGIADDAAGGDLDRELFVDLEEIFRELGAKCGVKMGVIQYSVWRYTVDRCANWRCHGCPLRSSCKRGISAPPQVEQLELQWDADDVGDD